MSNKWKTQYFSAILCTSLILCSSAHGFWFGHKNNSEDKPQDSRPPINERVRNILEESSLNEKFIEVDKTHEEINEVPIKYVPDVLDKVESDVVKDAIVDHPIKSDASEFEAAKTEVVNPSDAQMVINAETSLLPKTVSLTLRDTMVLALSHNLNLLSALMNPDSKLWAEEVARAGYDPNLTASLKRSSDKSSSNTTTETTTDGFTGALGLSQKYLNGMSLSLSGTYADTETGSASDRKSRGLSLSATLPLFQGRGADVNLVTIRQAELDTQSSWHDLETTVMELVSNVESAYWDLALAQKNLEIQEKALELSKQEAEEVRERIRLGRMAENEMVAAESDVAARQVQVIDAKSKFEKSRLTLLRLLDPERSGVNWVDTILTQDDPGVVKSPEDNGDTDMDRRALKALELRPDYLKALNSLKKGELSVVQTRNGLMPDLDLTLKLDDSNWDSTASSVSSDGNDKSISASLSYSLPFGQRAARANLQRSEISRDQAAIALRNLGLAIHQDVRTAGFDVILARERVKAASANSELKNRTYETEKEKFHLGRSTSFLVSQAAHALVSAQIAEQEAVVALKKAILQRSRVEGTLLSERGISVGAEHDGIAVDTRIIE